MKKRILTSAVAIVAAMSLSAAAFAAVEPGSTNGSQNGSADVVADQDTTIASESGALEVVAPAGAFGDTVTTVKMESTVTATDNTAAEATVTTLVAVAKKLEVETEVKVNTKLAITLMDQDDKAIQPSKAVTVTVAYDGVSNIVAYVNGDSVEFIALNVAEDKKTCSFETTHFSDYYLVEVAEADVEKLAGKSGTADAAGDVNKPSDDKNKPTGVVLAIVPAAVAAAAVVVSKKRK